jgi:hypothetical protein
LADAEQAALRKGELMRRYDCDFTPPQQNATVLPLRARGMERAGLRE